MIEVGGTLVRTFQVKDSTGVLANAGTLPVATVYWNDGTTNTGTVTNPSTGNYTVTYTPVPSKLGWHRLGVTASGANSTWSPNTDFRFWVVDEASLIVSLSQVKAGLNIPASDTTKDDWLVDALEAATPVIENIAGAIVPTSLTETHNGGSATVLLYERVNAITSVTVDGVVLSASDYSVDKTAGILYRGTGLAAGSYAFSPGIGNVVVVYTTGFAVTPANVRLATCELIRHWAQNGQQGSRPAFGGAAVEAPMGASFAVPRRVMELLEPSASNAMPGLA